MLNFITLSCPSCGNQLHITEDIDRFACAACGNEHIVNRSGGIVSLKPVIDSIKSLQLGVDKTASELAIVRIKKEIEELERALNNVTNEAEIRGYQNIEQNNSSLALGITLTIGLLLIVISIINSYVEGALIVVFISGIFIIFFLHQNSQKNKENERRGVIGKNLVRESSIINNNLDNKKRELIYHQEIVSKYK